MPVSKRRSTVEQSPGCAPRKKKKNEGLIKIMLKFTAIQVTTKLIQAGTGMTALMRTIPIRMKNQPMKMKKRR